MSAQSAGEFAVSLSAVRAAAQALDGVVLRTPLLENPDVNRALGGRLLLKAESAQRTGAFKIRGAYYRLLRATSEERARGAISYSSGNHALGVARASDILGSSALIVMPSDAPIAKKEAVTALGAEVTTYDRDTQDYNDVVAHLMRLTGRIHVPPSAHGDVLAGAGTAALELFHQAQDLEAKPDAILVPCGGGGLTAATAIVAQGLSPDTAVYAVEPTLFDDTCRSLAAGYPVENPKGRRTICDAIMTPKPNEVTFPINKALLRGGVTVSDDAVRHAMRFAYDHFKIVTEPGGVVGLAAILDGAMTIKGQTVATIITGGNIDPKRFFDLIEGV